MSASLALTVALVAALAIYILWFGYIAVMYLVLLRDQGKLPRRLERVAIPGVVFYWLLDVALNWLVLTFVLLELPRELTVSSRLKRHNNPHGRNWRATVARAIEPYLDPIDPDGDHV